LTHKFPKLNRLTLKNNPFSNTVLDTVLSPEVMITFLKYTEEIIGAVETNSMYTKYAWKNAIPQFLQNNKFQGQLTILYTSNFNYRASLVRNNSQPTEPRISITKQEADAFATITLACNHQENNNNQTLLPDKHFIGSIGPFVFSLALYSFDSAYGLYYADKSQQTTLKKQF
jgi:hypothetical protein